MPDTLVLPTSRGWVPSRRPGAPRDGGAHTNDGVHPNVTGHTRAADDALLAGAEF